MHNIITTHANSVGRRGQYNVCGFVQVTKPTGMTDSNKYTLVMNLYRIKKGPSLHLDWVFLLDVPRVRRWGALTWWRIHERHETPYSYKAFVVENKLWSRRALVVCQCAKWMEFMTMSRPKGNWRKEWPSYCLKDGVCRKSHHIDKKVNSIARY